MADTFNPSDKRRDTRYPILGQHACGVHIERRGGKDDVETLEGELIDLSRGGAKLLVSTGLQFSEVVRLLIRIPALALEIDVTSEVCWTRPEGNSSWLIGCSFSPGISDEMLQKLAIHSFVERRRSPRYAVAAKAVVSWQSSDQRQTVRLKDISTGGFCMSCDQSVPLGSKVLLELPTRQGTALEITANVRWHMSSDDVHLVGCAFNSNKDYQALRDSICDDNDQKQIKSPRPYLTWTLAACGLLTICVLSAVGYLRDQSSSPAVSPVAAVVMTQRTGDTLDEWTDDVLDQPAVESSGPPLTDDATWPAQMISPDEDVTPAEDVRPAEDVTPAEDVRPSTAVAEDVSHPVVEPTVVPPAAAVIHEPAALAESMARDETDVPLPEMVDLPNDPPFAHPTATLPVATGVDGFESASRADNRDVAGEVTVPSLTDEPAQIAGQVSAEHSAPPRSAAATLPAVRTRPATENPRHAQQAFVRGDRAYRAGRYAEAQASFAEAVRNDAANPLYHYLLALAQYQSGQVVDAQSTVETAMALEQQHSIDNWGQKLTRYQGRAHIWLERQRAR